MKRLRFAGGLLLAALMLALGYVVASNLKLPASAPSLATAQTTATATAAIATATATPEAYPLPNRTPLPPPPTRTPVIYPTIGPKETLPPKPTPAPTATPTMTPVPTALPVPASAYEGLWVESVPNPTASYPDDYDSILWAADPRDVGHRRLVARFDRQNIYTVVVSPSGRQIAVTAGSNRPLGIPLYVLQADGSGLRQIAPNASQVLWSADEQTIAYTANRKPEQVDGSVIEVVDVPTVKQRRLVTLDDEVSTVQLISWLADRQTVGYVRSAPPPQRLRLDMWTTNTVSANVAKRGSIPQSSTRIIVSPDATSLLLRDVDTGKYVVVDLDRLTTKTLDALPRVVGVAWAPDNGILYFEYQEGLIVLNKINVQTMVSEQLTKIRPVPLQALMTQPIAATSDANWLTAYHNYTGLYLIHLPTGAIVHLPNANTPFGFGGWLRK